MIKKVIKTKAQASKVVNELVKDLEESLGIYNNYKVVREKGVSSIYVSVISPEGCSIITNAACENIMEVVQVYRLLYENINYHLETQRHKDEYIPAFTFSVSWREQK
jgi:hypothetical protein